ncbi:MAG: hypothetical protein US94_C0033G0008 [Berkelbacteria bacterium GW2011_GWB1_38_5]|uniref:Carboxypeptidase regulatory-like domain-containing protein n=1 Tax=Berkelbacteria bacterium GW2011_GWB1_38_5 TaxID=1618336 RepID=A0A0G0KDH0_9BACT|nr:MAG: hypothetical protein US94_C0033G0008 [Berkelbacteria bacterium GW2011_GWB1_38_5]
MLAKLRKINKRTQMLLSIALVLVIAGTGLFTYGKVTGKLKSSAVVIEVVFIKGKLVFDELSGEPLGGEKIYFYGSGPNGIYSYKLDEVETNGQGFYEAMIPSGDMVTVEWKKATPSSSANGCYEVSKRWGPIRMSAFTYQNANLILQPSAFIKGQVTSAGQPMAGASVKLFKNGRILDSGSTDTKGYYFLCSNNTPELTQNPYYGSKSKTETINLFWPGINKDFAL